MLTLSISLQLKALKGMLSRVSKYLILCLGVKNQTKAPVAKIHEDTKCDYKIFLRIIHQ